MANRQSIHSLATLVLFSLCAARAPAALVSEWRLDGDTADVAGDNNGVAAGGPAWAYDRYGDAGKALQFDGVDDAVACGTDASLSFGDGTADRPFSISAWAKMEDHHGFSIVGKAGEYALDNSNAFRLSLRDHSSGGSIGKSAGMLTPYEGKWVHLAATYDGSGTPAGITMFINGAAARGRDEGAAQYKAMEPRGGLFTIGRAWRHARGAIDDVRVYNHVLSPTDIAELADYFRGAAALTPPPVDDSGTVPRVTIQRVQAAPVIDGDLSDEAWRQAQWHDRFMIHGTTQQPAPLTTSFAVLHDGQNLILAVKADEPEPAKIKASVSARDGQSWMDDAIELFIDSSGDARTHYHFAVNTRGVVYDARVVRGGGKHEPEWSADTTVATATGENAWTVEMRIPLSCLSFGTEDLATCRLNLTRSRFITGTRELFTFAPVRGTFHDTPHFAPAHIAAADLTPYQGWRLDMPDVKVLCRSGQLEAHVTQGIESLSTPARKVELQARLRTGNRPAAVVRRAIDVAQGTQRETLIVPLPELGATTLDVALLDGEAGRICCSRRTFLTLDYQPLTVQVLRPHYQNAIFAGQTLDDIVLEVEAAVAPSERHEYVFDLVIKSAKDSIHARKKIEAGSIVVSVPLPRLAPGRYQMVGRLLHQASGRTVGEWHSALRSLPPREGEVRFDEHGACLIDGEPFMPFGIAGGWWPKAIGDAVAFGCNAIENCSITLSDQNLPYLDQLQSAGLKLLVYPYPEGFPTPVGRRSGPGDSLSAEQAHALRARVRARKQHPSILAWYTGNEPHSPQAPPTAMQQIHDVISDEDPYHPTVIINHNIALIRDYVDAMALVMPDPYPGFLKDGGWARPRLPTLAVREAVRASAGRKPIWAVLQAHDGTLFGGKGRRAPTLIDLRGQLYQAVVAGARGFFWYCRYWIEPHVEIGLTYLAREATVLREAILAPESPLEFAAVHDGEDVQDLHLSRRQPGADTCLFAVSSSEQPREVTFRVAALPDGPLFVVGESRTVEVRSGVFSDAFAPGATHIYSSAERLARPIRMATALRDIEANAHPTAKPGDLAAESRGGAVSVAQGPQPQRWPAPGYMNDGSAFSSWYRGPLPQQVDVVLAQPQHVSRVVLDANISHVEVQAWHEDAWRTVAEARSARADVRRETQTIRFAPVQTGKLRILARAVKSVMSMPDRVVQIWGIEVYADAK